MGQIKYTINACKSTDSDVSLCHGETNLDNRINALSTVANLRNVTTKNGCTATLHFSEKGNPHIRREVAELLLHSIQKRSEAT